LDFARPKTFDNEEMVQLSKSLIFPVKFVGPAVVSVKSFTSDGHFFLSISFDPLAGKHHSGGSIA
jgi:hypothetical protein